MVDSDSVERRIDPLCRRCFLQIRKHGRDPRRRERDEDERPAIFPSTLKPHKLFPTLIDCSQQRTCFSWAAQIWNPADYDSPSCLSPHGPRKTLCNAIQNATATLRFSKERQRCRSHAIRPEKPKHSTMTTTVEENLENVSVLSSGRFKWRRQEQRNSRRAKEAKVAESTAT